MDQDLLKHAISLTEKKSPTTVYIFDRTDYYVCINGDAEFIASKIYESHAFIKSMTCGDETVPYLTINKNQFQRIVKELLLLHQYRIELFKSKNKSQTWTVAVKASPGNLGDFEEIVAECDDVVENTGVAAVKFLPSPGTSSKLVAVGYCDITSQVFLVAEFCDGINFTSLQSFLLQVSPKEILLPNNERDADYKLLEPFLREFGVITYRKQAEFSTDDVVQDLNRLLETKKGVQFNAMSLPEMKLTGAMSCVAAAISYLNLTSDSAAFGHYKLNTFAFGQYMRLDANVVRSLELFSTGNQYDSKWTLFGLLNQCRTAPGKRLLDQWIKTPLLDINKINERLDVVDALMKDTETRESLSSILSRFPDLLRTQRNFVKQRATLQDLYKLYQAAKTIPKIIGNLERCSKQNNKSIFDLIIDPLQTVQTELCKLVDLVCATVDLEGMRDFEIFIKADVDDALSKTKEKMSALEEKIENEANRIARELNYELGKVVKLESSANLGFYLRITQKEEKVIRKNPAISIFDANKSGAKFRTAKLTKLNDEYLASKHDYETVQQDIVKEVLKVAGTFGEPVQRLCVITATLDVLVSFANVSRSYVRPVVLESDVGIMEIRDSRHPCLEARENFAFIPNDLILKRDETEFLLITGPNMGGKSTYLRQAGLIVLMAQIGCFVPCSSARMSVVDAIFTRVGASDSQLEGSSTFRIEMIEMSAILEAATSKSLVLIDELGRGTSTYDGSALAWSIAEHIAKNVKCWCLFATHFHELTALDIDIPTVKNVHVDADVSDKNLVLLYKVKEGCSGSSFGIHIVKLLNFPDSVVQDAALVLNDFAWAENAIGNDHGKHDDEEQIGPPATRDKMSSKDSLSAISLVTELRRIVKNDRLFKTQEEKAAAVRATLANGFRCLSS